MLGDMSSLSSLTGSGRFDGGLLFCSLGSLGGVREVFMVVGGSGWLTCGRVCVVLPMVDGWWWRVFKLVEKVGSLGGAASCNCSSR